MEKTINILKENKEKNYNEKICLDNRKCLHIDGIIEIISTSEASLIMKLKDTMLSISGANIHITRLDVSTGILEAEGDFYSIKYGKNSNIFKRIFKWNYPIHFK